MKKLMNWMLATILICGASVFTSCSQADEPVTPPVDNKKCSRVEVIYRITSPKTNYDYFEGKFALKSGNEVKEIKKLLTFAEQQNESYNVKMSYTVTSYNAQGEKLDTQTISDRWNESGSVKEKADLESAVKMSYSELHASVAEDGKITLSLVNKMHAERSGIEW